MLETGTGQAGEITINSSLSYQHSPPVFHFLIMAVSSLPRGGLTHPDSSPAWLVFRRLLHYLCGLVLFWKSSRTCVRPVFGPGTLISLSGVNPCLPTHLYTLLTSTPQNTCRIGWTELWSAFLTLLVDLPSTHTLTREAAPSQRTLLWMSQVPSKLLLEAE